MPPVTSNAEEPIILSPSDNNAGIAGVHSYGRFDLLAFRGVIVYGYVNVGTHDGLGVGRDG